MHYGRLAQLVQSASLTRRKSLVQIQYRPPSNNNNLHIILYFPLCTKLSEFIAFFTLLLHVYSI